MSNVLPDVRAVVHELGGVAVVARLFDVVETAVWNWISADAFPAYTQSELKLFLKKRRKAAPDALWPRSRRSRRPASASSRKEATA